MKNKKLTSTDVSTELYNLFVYNNMEQNIVKIQALTYLCNWSYYKQYNELLFEDEILKGEYGPIFMDFVYKFCGWATLKYKEIKPIENEIPKKQQIVINEVFSIYGILTDEQLIEVIRENKDLLLTERNKVIDKELLKESYEKNNRIIIPKKEYFEKKLRNEPPLGNRVMKDKRIQKIKRR